MPSFDIVSEIDMQEVRNAVDNATRDLSTRLGFP
ncbi:putative nucleotide-binding protein [Serratia fonticola]|uniref:Putative nucleotide-binding protein n=1 Tax=Serratia fonticola TaxID=47917 RepID=A0A4U9U848_SERFO|nr:putative nucleotide-binding protein [Serratia fonticola]